MSSIDKYVEGEARKCNPNVKIIKKGNNIKGYIGKKLVFSIADRYGYLCDSELSTIRNSIKEYEEEEQQHRINEQIRIENERITARLLLKNGIDTAKNKIEESYTNIKRLGAGAESSLNEILQVSSMTKYNISSYTERAQTLNSKFRNCMDKLEHEFKTKMQELESLKKTISDDSTKQTYIKQQDSLKKIHFNFTNINFPISEIDQLKSEIEKLRNAISQIENVKKELDKISNDGLIGSIATSALKEIRQFNISSLDDVNKLFHNIHGYLNKIHNLEFQQQSKERSSQIAVLNGILNSCCQLREYLVSQPYEAINNRNEIVETANRVLGIYTELDSAVYTTCSKEKIKKTFEFVQKVLVGSASDVYTLDHLRRLLEEGHVYKRDDNLQADNYTDYTKKFNELIERGVPVDEIEAFDAINYSEQKNRLIEILLELDVREGVNRTLTSFIMAWKIMEDMGYRLLYQNMGEEGTDALACEGIFVMPGCEGVVWQVIASDCNISRKVIGVKRLNGLATSPLRVKEVAKILEHDGENNDFFQHYATEGGGELKVTNAVYTDMQQSEQVIQNNGCFELSAEGEKRFDELVQSGDVNAKMKWRTRIETGNVQKIAQKDGLSCNIRQQESQRAAARIRQCR